MNDERTRKNVTAILHAISREGQNTVATRTGLSETKVSRLKDQEVSLSLADIGRLLSAVELKCVPAEMKCYPQEYIEKLHYFAQIGMQASPEDVSRMMTSLEF